MTSAQSPTIVERLRGAAIGLSGQVLSKFIPRNVSAADCVEAAALIDELTGALRDAETAILQLDEGSLGFAEVQTGEEDECFIYPLRDELLSKISAALAKAQQP